MSLRTLCCYACFVLVCPLLVDQGAVPTAYGNPPPLEAEEIQAAIRADIEDAERISGETPQVKIAKGVVTLSGTVDSLQERELAARIAKRTRGVQAVRNQILVKRSDREDKEIQADVEKVLRINDSVAEPRVKSKVDGGTVTLAGTVDSLAEKRIIGFAASGVRGVTGVDNQVTVRMSSDRTDAEIRDEIKALIVQSVYFDDAIIDVQVEDHVARLSGEVVSATAKDRLERIAEIWGVAAVDVRGVAVNPEAANPTERERRYADVSDQEIADAIQLSFRVDPIVFSRVDQIELDTQKGVVTLHGTVDRLRVKKRAAQLAGDVVGVSRVHNQLEVEYATDKPSDMEIIQETQAALARSAYLERSDFRVHCQRAHVSLYGVVESELQKQVAESIADAVRGVVHVNNSLAVEPQPSDKSDAEILADIERKLKFVLFEDSSNIDVTVKDGVAILRGEVQTWRQWQTVMELALEAGGSPAS